MSELFRSLAIDHYSVIGHRSLFGKIRQTGIFNLFTSKISQPSYNRIRHSNVRNKVIEFNHAEIKALKEQQSGCRDRRRIHVFIGREHEHLQKVYAQ